MNRPLTFALLLASTTAGVAASAVPVIVNRYSLGESGGWDYLTYEASSHRLFIPRGDRVMIIDADNGVVRGEIADTAGVHGVALVAALGKGFTSDGQSNTVTAFDLDTLKVRQKIVIKGDKPDAIVFDSASDHLFVFNGRSNNISVIDPASETLIDTIELSSNPEFAVADGRGKLYVNLEGSASLAAIDTMRNTVVSTWFLGDCDEPTGLALDVADHLSFSTCQNQKMIVFDVKHGKAVTALAIGGRPDAAAFDASRKLVYASNGEGSLSIYHVANVDHGVDHADTATRFSLVAEVPTQKSARTMALDSVGQRIFLAAAEFGAAPEPTVETPKPRPPMIPNSFSILVLH